MNKLKTLDKGLDKILKKGKTDTEKTTKELSKRIKKIDKEKSGGEKENKHQSFAVYLSRKNEDRFSKAIFAQKLKSERKSDVSKTVIAEKLILEWTKQQGY
jgi:hypothetical protein